MFREQPLSGAARRRLRKAPGRPARLFPLRLPLQFRLSATGRCGEALTEEVGRTQVTFVGGAGWLEVGDVLDYGFLLPGVGGKAGSQAVCRGRVVFTDGGRVAVSVERYRLRPLLLVPGWGPGHPGATRGA